MIIFHPSHDYYFSLFFNLAFYTVHYVPKNTSALWEATMYFSQEILLNSAREMLGTKKISNFPVYPL